MILFPFVPAIGYSIGMHPTKVEIKAWLKNAGHSREWLGEQCGGMSKNTVNNWLSTSINIPDGTLSLIARLMAEDVERAKDKADPLHHLILTVKLDEFRCWERAALRQSMTTTDYCVEAIREAYKADMGLTAMADPAEKQSAPESIQRAR